MIQRRSYFHGWQCVVVAAGVLAACGPSAPKTTATSPRWGNIAAEGPATSGKDLGKMEITLSDGTKVMGEAFDSNGDGKADEIDLNGDGISDGEDVNGDGLITVWSDLENGDDNDTTATMEEVFPQTPDNAENLLASTAPFPGEKPTGPTIGKMGGVNLIGGMVPTGVPVAGVLAARQQAGIGSCAAFATAGAVTLLRYSQERIANPTVDPNTLWAAPLYVYQYNSKYENGSCGGTNIQQNLSRYTLNGAPEEEELKYPPLDPWPSGTNPVYCTAPKVDLAETSAHRNALRIDGYVEIGGTGVEFRNAVKRQLNMGRPVVFGTTLPLGFLEFRATAADATDNEPGAVTDVTKPFKGNGGNCTGTTHCGGHAMLFTGYDDTRGAYRVLNSWGADWGDNGYMWWDYAALEALNPYATAPIALPADAAPLTTPDPTNVSVMPVMMAPPVYTKLSMCCGQTGWGVILRLRWSEPVTITQIVLDFDAGGNPPFPVSTGMLEGDVVGTIEESYGNANFDPMTFVGKTGMVTLSATLRNGVMVTRTVGPITVPMPTN